MSVVLCKVRIGLIMQKSLELILKAKNVHKSRMHFKNENLIL